MNSKAIHAKAIELDRAVLKMTTLAGAGHPSSAISLSHLIVVLMYQQMRFDPANPWSDISDRLVLSEGHAVPIVYAAYADLGGSVGKSPKASKILQMDDLDGLRKFGSVLDGHPNPAEGFPFFDAATGSLGMGLSVAAGLGLAARLNRSDRKIYCLIGDGESREGQIYESLDFIVDQKLTSVCAIFNCNGEGQAGKVSAQQSAEKMYDKLRVIGWEAALIDGHEPEEIAQAFDRFEKATKPFAIVARTVKGWGVASLRGGNFHGKPLSTDQLSAGIQSLDEQWKVLGCSSGGALTRSHGESGTGNAPIDDLPGKPGANVGGSLNNELVSRRISLPDFWDALEQNGLAEVLSKKKLATRRAYGVTLKLLGDADERIVALDGDVSNSTFAEIFARHHPDRFFECKIAEQNMISTAAGLAAGGKIPFASSFAKFLGRGYDQIELAAITRADVKLVGSHSGLGPASDGPSQMALSDMAFFYGLSSVENGLGKAACTVFQPADAVATYRLTELMANMPGLCYLRTHRPEAPFIYPPDEMFEVGGFKILREGGDAVLLSSGYMVVVALAACGLLESQGVRCTLIDAYSLPLKTDGILDLAEKAGGLIVCVEDNYEGGFGTAVAQAAARVGGVRVRTLCVPRIPKSARTPEELMDAYGLSREGIARRVVELMKQNKR